MTTFKLRVKLNPEVDVLSRWMAQAGPRGVGANCPVSRAVARTLKSCMGRRFRRWDCANVNTTFTLTRIAVADKDGNERVYRAAMGNGLNAARLNYDNGRKVEPTTETLVYKLVR